MTVHNHGIDPSCKERTVGECLLGKDVVHLRLVATPEHTVKALRVLLTGHHDFGRAVIEPLIRQIEEQTKPPRIPEPGVWGVVTANTIGANGKAQDHYLWVRTHGGWEAIASMQPVRQWDDLIDPVLVREGV